MPKRDVEPCITENRMMSSRKRIKDFGTLIIVVKDSVGARNEWWNIVPLNMVAVFKSKAGCLVYQVRDYL